MRRANFEYNVDRIVSSVLGGTGGGEDGNFECKAVFGASHPRQLAGLANSARGEPVYLIFGLDQPGRVLVPSWSLDDPNDWWQRIRAGFDGDAPQSLIEAELPVDGGTVYAVAFDTSTAPFVVKVDGSQILEVPIREGTGTRSATHRDLIRILEPRVFAPEIEDVFVEASSGMMGFEGRMAPGLFLTVMCFVEQPAGQATVLPYHRASLSVVLDDGGLYSELRYFSMSPPGGEAHAAAFSTAGQITMVGSAWMHAFVGLPTGSLISTGRQLDVTLSLRTAFGSHPLRIEARSVTVQSLRGDVCFDAAFVPDGYVAPEW